MLYDDEYYLEHIPPYMWNRIKTLLDYEECWKKLQKFQDLYNIIKPPDILAPQESPGEHILIKLKEILCTMGQLRDIFKEFELYDALSTFYTESLAIRIQPTEEIESSELFLKRSARFSLQFSVWGIPQPKYQWYKDEELIPDQSSSHLFYESYKPEMEGEYYCIATQTVEDLRTNEKKIVSVKSDFVDVGTQQERCVITKMPPTEISRKVGDSDIVLEIIADGFPVPRYQWMHNNHLLENNKFKIKIPTHIEMTGVYRCRIFNGINEIEVKIRVIIIDPNFKFPISLDKVTEKVALLIGNQTYMHQPELKTPVNDTKALRKKLESLGFLVLNANDLTLNGMIHAIEYFKRMCCENCMAVFYYAGHGFEFGEKYLMPTDVPDSNNYRLKDNICEYKILKEILSKRPKLFLTLLDMCLVFPNREQNPGIFEENRKVVYQFDCARNLIRGYSTTTGFSAIECQKVKHSVYNCLLQEYITQKVPILQMLRAINNEFEELAKSSGQMKIAAQMPTITDHISQDYYLNVDKEGHPPSKQVLDSLQRSKAATKPNIQGN